MLCIIDNGFNAPSITLNVSVVLIVRKIKKVFILFETFPIKP